MTRSSRALRLAIAFLTIVPVPIGKDEATPAEIAEARYAYPFVGLMIGLAFAALSELLRRAGVDAGPSAFLLVAMSAILTGGLHLDGLADTADGLFLWGDADRRLTVMRDPRVGSFGVVALLLLILGKFAALSSLGDLSRSFAMVGAATVARSLILISAGLAPYARPEGTGRSLVEAATRRDAMVGSVTAMIIGALSAGWRGLLASVVAIGLASWLTGQARRKLGGVTGDILGAVVELGEFSFLFTLALLGG